MSAATNDSTAMDVVTFSMAHTERIETDADIVFQTILRVEDWPQFFPPCKAARVVETNGDVVVEITASVGPSSRTWLSRRKVNESKRRLDFEQLDPFPPLLAMSGSWEVRPLSDGASEVELDHVFTTNPRAAGATVPPKTVTEAMQWVREVCDSNSHAELTALKKRCESRVKLADGAFTFRDEVSIPGSPKAIRDHLWRADLWPGLLPHVHRVEMLESTERSQRFRMLSGDGDAQPTESVRRLTETGDIVYEQTAPPPLLRLHAGRWTLVETADGVRVVSEHTVALDPERIESALGRGYTVDEAKVICRHLIGNHSVATLKAIRARVQRPATEAGNA